ncbi:ribosome maturation factor RimM [Salirhabdus salicampi]|uniref:ribosome maturation factor RimM n=1 Tax=Salirhabdus salicampi TaxID=476102 RepID=UPI0020C283B7|nr:ribosome maturation factor RimM [Salirhabdus salicampi]MCP8616544.1 ribosome maturation factor RimM [Salirhabdus salicampi]
MTEKYFNVGKVVNTHGIKGEVKVVKITDFEERFKPGSILYWVSPNGDITEELEVSSYRTHKNFHMLRFKGYDSINDVERFKGGTLKVTEEQLTPLAEGEYYYYEIIGSTVVTDEGEELGVIKEVLAPGANDVWVVERKKGKDLLIPYIDDVVRTVDIHNKKVTIQPMEGLLD